jgi:hypothetical protein
VVCIKISIDFIEIFFLFLYLDLIHQILAHEPPNRATISNIQKNEWFLKIFQEGI